MADTPKDVAPEKEKVEKTVTKYFKNTTYPGGGISLGFAVPTDPTTERLVKFVKYAFKVRGDDVLEGYLATSDPVEIKALEADRYAEAIEKSEYEKALKDGRQVV